MSTSSIQSGPFLFSPNRAAAQRLKFQVSYKPVTQLAPQPPPTLTSFSEPLPPLEMDPSIKKTATVATAALSSVSPSFAATDFLLPSPSAAPSPSGFSSGRRTPDGLKVSSPTSHSPLPHTRRDRSRSPERNPSPEKENRKQEDWVYEWSMELKKPIRFPTWVSGLYDAYRLNLVSGNQIAKKLAERLFKDDLFLSSAQGLDGLFEICEDFHEDFSPEECHRFLVALSRKSGALSPSERFQFQQKIRRVLEEIRTKISSKDPKHYLKYNEQLQKEIGKAFMILGLPPVGAATAAAAACSSN